MKSNRLAILLWRSLAGIASASVLFASSCGAAELRAVLAGVDAAADRLERNHDDDISFGDWLADELDD